MSGQKEIAVYLLDMLDHIGFIEEFMADGQWDNKTRLAVERAFTIIPEAARRIPEAYKAQQAQIPWAEINGFRNIIVHEYETVNPAIVRDIISNHLHPLKAELQKLLNQS